MGSLEGAGSSQVWVLRVQWPGPPRGGGQSLMRPTCYLGKGLIFQPISCHPRRNGSRGCAPRVERRGGLAPTHKLKDRDVTGSPGPVVWEGFLEEEAWLLGLGEDEEGIGCPGGQDPAPSCPTSSLSPQCPESPQGDGGSVMVPLQELRLPHPAPLLREVRPVHADH